MIDLEGLLVKGDLTLNLPLVHGDVDQHSGLW